MRNHMIGLALCGWLVSSMALSAEPADRARQILDETGFSGGLAVHLGCGDGHLTSALGAGEGVLVHGLDTCRANVQQARSHAKAMGQLGKVTADVFDGKHLPLIDQVVNLLVAETLGDVALEEVMRVLAPRGIAYVCRDGQWTKTVKPWPDDIDQWTHYLYDASNNAVSQDRRVGPLKHFQWQSGPRWSRHHDHMASVSAMVSAQGRVFCILDEGSPASPQLPPDWQLVARDAFNGVLLWKRPIPEWHDALWPLKSGPADLPRRLVAHADVVYTTLGITAPVSALDAATGQKLCEYAGTDGAEEIMLRDGHLLVLVNRTPVDYDADQATDPEQGQSRDGRTTYSSAMGRLWSGIRSRRWSHGDRVIRALDADSGRLLWEQAGRVIPLTLAADAENVYYHDGDKIVALQLANGRPRWQSEPVPVWQGMEGRGIQSWFAPTLVAVGDKVLFAGGEKMHMSYVGWGSQDIGQDTMTALSAETGEKLWTAEHPYSGYNSPEDLLVAQGKVWVGSTAKGGPQGYYAGHDLNTGRAEVTYPPTLDTYWFHHRCHRAKATEQYVLCSRTGIEFVDLATGDWKIHHWVRGGCLYGIMPANGLIYAPPHPCACYPEAKLYGMVALAATSPTRALPEHLLAHDRLQRGPAYAEMQDDAETSESRPSHGEQAGDVRSEDSAWPTFRANPARSGHSAATMYTALKPAWETELGGTLSAPVAAEGKLLVAVIDTHTVHALDLATGQPAWSFTAGGRIDSPPTVWQGRVFFGSADGSVYCLRTGDGSLVWRFLAAPVDRRMVAFEQLESVWPVHGAVLVQDGVVTAVAGRSMFLDGGLRLCRLDAVTGELLGEQVLDDQDPLTGDDLQRRVKGLNMPVALPDILASDGQRLFMRSQVMDLEGNRLTLEPGGAETNRVLAAYGFTEDSWFHRVYWLFGDSFQGGVGGFAGGAKRPAGRLLVHDENTIFGYGRKPEYFRWGSAIDYHLFAAPRPGSASVAPAAIFFDKSSSLNPTRLPLTIAAWVKTDAADGTVLVRGAQQNGFALILADGRPRMLLRTGGKTHEASASKKIGSTWTHIAGVLAADGKMVVYVDGEPGEPTENVPMLSGDPLIPMKVGYDDTNQLLPDPLTPFHGALDEVLLYHLALDAEQIRDLAAGKSQFTSEDREGQVLHLTFDRGQVRDSSPAGNHGRIENVKRTEGRVGDAILLEQPKQVAVIQPSRRTGPVHFLWNRDVAVSVRAMALAGDTLLCAGPPDMVDEVAAFQSFRDPAVQQQLLAQDAALRGQSGGSLLSVHAGTGETRAEYPLGSPPVFDGLIVANGRALIATMDGRILAFESKR